MSPVRPGVLTLTIALACACTDEDAAKTRRKRGPVPVEVAEVATGPIELRRTYTGSVRARERFVVAADVSGRVQRLLVDLADPVTRGQVVAELDDQEDAQGVNSAAAQLAVARANLASAESALVIATRELERVEQLRASHVLAASEVDRVKAQHLAATTNVEVAQAQIKRMESELKGARIRSSYNKVVAMWTPDPDDKDADDKNPDQTDARRFIAERSVAEGDRVTAGQPLFTVVDLDPVLVIVDVGEKEYGYLKVGQAAAVTTEAYPGETFAGEVRRIAPVFNENSRQARVELLLANERHLLKPGMFVRARIALRRQDVATIVPESALTSREGKTGVFVVDAAGERVAWQPVVVGIRDDERVQITDPGSAPDSLSGKVSGRVVVLGHQLVRDGAAITIPGRAQEEGRSVGKPGGKPGGRKSAGAGR